MSTGTKIELDRIHCWIKSGLTLEKLAVLTVAESPLPEAEIAKRAGVSLRMVQKFSSCSDGFLKVVKHKEKCGYLEGRPASKAIKRTAKANRLLL